MTPALIATPATRKDRLGTIFASLAFWCVVSSAAAGLLSWDARYAMNADGVTYLDMATEALHHGPAALVNSCWGALYPLLIALSLWIIRPSAAGEFQVVHFVNWLIFVAALLSLIFFLKSWLRDEKRKPGLAPLALCMFFWSVTEMIGFGMVTPDVLAACPIFLGAGIACRLRESSADWKQAVCFGVILGMGYLVKPSLLLTGILGLATLLLCLPRGLRHRCSIATLSFVAISAPYVVLMSRHVGRFSISENGVDNYLFKVNQASPIDLIRSDALVHPPRILMERPLTLEFAHPVEGTYPMHYEPTHWIAGAKLHFSLKEQIAALSRNLRVYWDLFLKMRIVCAGFAVLALLGRKDSILRMLDGRSSYWVVFWPVSVCAALLLVYVEERYIAPFAVLLGLAAYRFVLPGTDRYVQKAVLLTVMIALLIPVGGQVLWAGGRAARDLIIPGKSDALIIAEAVSDAGVKPGDFIGIVGSGYSAIQYARLARARIVAEIPDEESFWQASAAESQQAEQRLAGIGVKVLVTANAPSPGRGAGWRQVTGTKYSHFWIHPLLATL